MTAPSESFAEQAPGSSSDAGALGSAVLVHREIVSTECGFLQSARSVLKMRIRFAEISFWDLKHEVCSSRAFRD